MVLPLNLAMMPSEIAAAPQLPARIAWMACHFCACTEGLADIPESLPEHAMLILNDRESCAGHSPDLVAQQLLDTVEKFDCESVLLDFQRPWDPEADVMAKVIVQALPCPTAVTESFAGDLSCPVFLAPCALHRPLTEHFQPWIDREIWLEAALCQEKVTVTTNGTTFTPIFPTSQLTGGFYEKRLCCRYRTVVSDDAVTFTLFDTPESLKEKLQFAASLGVTRAVGLYQELGTFLTGKSSSCPSIAKSGKA